VFEVKLSFWLGRLIGAGLTARMNMFNFASAARQVSQSWMLLRTSRLPAFSDSLGSGSGGESTLGQGDFSTSTSAGS
jgi:hypothetical protein